MTEVMLRSVRKVYPNGFQAIHGIDLEIADGELIVLVGPSGCGKSTLLRMIAGLETVTEGEVEIAGRMVNDLEPADRDIAMVFQNYALYPHMSVFNNMAYGLRNRRTPKAEIAERVGRTAQILELADLLERRPRQLSGGQRQRVAMGRAIVREPAVFLFDEPLSNLDAKLRVQMRVEIKRLQRRLATTSIYVTHDQVEAMTLADRLVVMNDGVAEQVGSPLEVYARPATVFVAGFIGSPAMNILSGRTAEDGKGVVLDGSSQTLPCQPPASTSDGPFTIGIRPEHLEPVSRDAATLELSVDLVDALGADSLVHGQLADNGPTLTVRVDGAMPVRTDDLLPLALSADDVHFFDAASGRRLV